MIEVCIDSSEDVSITDLAFDYARPTVSEFLVTSISDEHADIQVHEDSWYEIANGAITWVGEGWQYNTGLAQELDLETNEIWRRGDPLAGMALEEITPFRLRATGRHDMKPGRVYQLRDTFRDCAGVFARRSANIVWRNVRFRYLHGMGIVNQFCGNLTFDAVAIAPDPGSGRTCAAWADGIQVSGCRGKLVVKECTFSGSHDDAINVHGTYLRVVENLAERRIKVRFMHRQTYGFMAFNVGDEIDHTHWDSLETYGSNVVTDAVLLNPKEMLLTLERPVPADFRKNDAVENATWTPDVAITGCTVSRTPTRGFLVATRRKAIVAGNRFNRTHMSAILLGIDAHDWYESGPVRDMTIRDNVFVECGEPVVEIDPHNTVANDSVHRNIRVTGNRFLLRDCLAVAARSARNLTVSGNLLYPDSELTDGRIVRTSDCAGVRVEKNLFLSSAEWSDQSATATLPRRHEALA